MRDLFYSSNKEELNLTIDQMSNTYKYNRRGMLKLMRNTTYVDDNYAIPKGFWKKYRAMALKLMGAKLFKKVLSNDGIVFDSVGSCADHYNINMSTVRRAILMHKSAGKWKGFFKYFEPPEKDSGGSKK